MSFYAAWRVDFTMGELCALHCVGLPIHVPLSVTLAETLNATDV